MSQATSQKPLSQHQVAAFHVDAYAPGQAADFAFLTKSLSLNPHKSIVDVGGGCGHFADAVRRSTCLAADVVDLDENSLEICRRLYPDVGARKGDALAPTFSGKEGVACFNLILHHLVGANDRATMELQKRALTVWSENSDYVFVNEYDYDSYIPGASGRLIFELTRSRLASAALACLGKFIPAFRANTFGVGVRFRSQGEWLEIFANCNLEAVSIVRGKPEFVSTLWRLLLLRTIRRDSFLLRRRGR